MSSLEKSIEAKLSNWRYQDSVQRTDSVGESKKPRKKKGAKRRRPTAGVEPFVHTLPSTEAVVPSSSISAGQSTDDDALSQVLISSSPTQEWSDVPRKLKRRVLSLNNASRRDDNSSRNSKDGDASQASAKGHDLHNGKIANARDFVETHRFEVGALGSSALAKKERKLYQNAQLLRLGCRRPKNLRMPIGMLNGMRKKQREDAKKEKQRLVEEGMLVSSKRRRH